MYYNNSVLLVSTSNCDISTRSCLTTIDDLAPFTPYIIEVSCSTRAGEGPLTNSTKVNTTIGSEFIINCILKDCIVNNDILCGHHHICDLICENPT